MHHNSFPVASTVELLMFGEALECPFAGKCREASPMRRVEADLSVFLRLEFRLCE